MKLERDTKLLNITNEREFHIIELLFKNMQTVKGHLDINFLKVWCFQPLGADSPFA